MAGCARLPRRVLAVLAVLACLRASSDSIVAGGTPLKITADKRLAFCVCAKCGSTSIYHWLFEAKYNKTWVKGNGLIHGPQNPQWGGFWAKTPSSKDQAWEEDPGMLKVALIRDPKKRIVSSWRSKMACDSEHYKVDGGRAGKIRSLTLLAIFGPPSSQPARAAQLVASPKCLSLEEFLRLVARVHAAGNERYLNPHFRPQQFWCFGRLPIEKWDLVFPLANDAKAGEASQQLYERLGHPRGAVPPPFFVKHQSVIGNTTNEVPPTRRPRETQAGWKAADVREPGAGEGDDVDPAELELDVAEPDREPQHPPDYVSPKGQALLDFVTQAEYRFLKPYL